MSPSGAWRGSGSGRWGSRGRGGNRRVICRNFSQSGGCKFGASCTFSHETSNGPNSSEGRLARTADTPEQLQAKEDYNSWKRLIKRPPVPNDIDTITAVWTGALSILNSSDRNWRQMLPRDLDDEVYFGYKHIHTIMGMTAGRNASITFVELAGNFLSAMTHPALLDCLSVDTAVGNLYNYISGSNGTRAIPFFKRFIANLVDAHTSYGLSKTSAETALISISTSLLEILRRGKKVAFNDDLPDLVESLHNTPEVVDMTSESAPFQTIANKVVELRAIIARAQGLLIREEEPEIHGISTSVVQSTYPRNIDTPGGRHNNDHADITKIQLLPTEEEIRSDWPEFLPTTNRDEPHFLTDQAERHLDTHFRLLRHDIFGELKDALGGLLNSMSEDANKKIHLGNIRAYHYTNAHIGYVSFHQRRGLQPHISFNQQHALRNKSSLEKRKWWEESKRLEEGVLLCFVSTVDGRSSLLFLTVSEKCTDPKMDHTLTSEDQQATIITKFTAWHERDMELMIGLSCRKAKGILIEFPGVLLATFIPILENLQNMQRRARFPFRNWILPDRTAPGAGIEPSDVLAPLYARAPEFNFCLDTLLNDDLGSLSINPRLLNSVSLDTLESRTGLDRGQCEALIAALSREFVIIQGPPGTGKSHLGIYLMRVLLASKDRANLGPIIVVCYTNHALDQFLEHLAKIGVEKIIRIGGQSQSKVLEGKNLRVVSKEEGKTKTEGYCLAMAYKELEELNSDIKHALGRLHAAQKHPTRASLYSYLERRFPRILSQFSRIDNDGFKIVGPDPLDKWLGGIRGDTVEESMTLDKKRSILDSAERNVNSLSALDRTRLVGYWVKEIRDGLTDDLYEKVKQANRIQKQLDNIHDEVDRRTLETADVIGVTTTGLAKRISVLQHIKSKVIICEEAGEVLESHMLSAMLPSAEHIIQIGDHQQLRPQINNHELSLEGPRGASYQLDRSQFERLSDGEAGRKPFPYAQLNVQRRMRPEISRLIRTLYPRLIDHESTKMLPDVVGMRTNVFWLDHENYEEMATEDRHQKSHSNVWEVDMTHALVRHIVRQGVYKSSDIAVLTPYTGQLQKLRKKMRGDFEIVLSERDQETLTKDGFSEESILSKDDGKPLGVTVKPLEKKQLSDMLRIGTVDNFQGEEAKVVIVSLVRSNLAQKVGFLKTTNRINVLLSRAQHGMYLIGNSQTYSRISMWGKILGILRSSDSVGKAFSLCCPRHTETQIQVSEPPDFERLSPEGGCQLPCDRRLSECGHRCLAKCHSEAMHQVFRCPQPCQRLHSPCKHACQKATCGEDCGKCMVVLNDVLLPCGHIKDGVYCHQTLDLAKICCKTSVLKTVPGCNHLIKVKCSQDTERASFHCSSPCNINLGCGHQCPGTCGTCYRRHPDGVELKGHSDCPKECGRPFSTCNHNCPQPCHDGNNCGVCFSLCEVRCSHSRCPLKCHEPCAPCIELCSWSCEHNQACYMPCSAPCSRLPCNKRCTKTLICGHQCPSLCGEICPENYCQTCSDKRDSRVDLLEMKRYEEIDLSDSPIVVLGCGHFFTAETLDGIMGMSDVYTTNMEGEFIGLRDISSTLARSIPLCPDCQCPVRQYVTQRYNRIINRAVMDEISKRFLVNAKSQMSELEDQASNLELNLQSSWTEVSDLYKTVIQEPENRIGESTRTIKKLLAKRHSMFSKVESGTRDVCKKVHDRNTPVRKLHGAIVTAKRKASPEQLMAGLKMDDSIPAVSTDLQINFRGKMVQLKLEYIRLNDKFMTSQFFRSTDAKLEAILNSIPANLDAVPFLESCMSFIDECRAVKLPKLAVEASLFYGSIARSYSSFCYSKCKGKDLETTSTYVQNAQDILRQAAELCKMRFENAESLRQAVEECMRLSETRWYEEVTPEEIAAIKSALVQGPRGIATHSGHWYNCQNGHPFVIGECGMPMEQARCPECGATVGGQHHMPVDGVTRATEMEDV